MKLILPLTLAGLIGVSTPAVAAVQWLKITENSVNDKFFVDAASIQRRGTIVWYWEYREFTQPNDAIVDAKLSQPLYGAIMRWSVDCTNKSQRLRRLNAYTKDRQLVQRFDYGNTGTLSQARPGSSAHKVIEHVCNPQNESKPEAGKKPEAEAP